MTKTWLVTGTSSGFGRELATLLAQQPDINLVATARKLADLAYLDAYDHGQIAKSLLDVTVADQITATVQLAQDRFGGIDVLVNNAGLGYFATIEESDPAAVRHLFEVNVFGLAAMTKAVLPMMRGQHAGTIVNLSSALGLVTLPTMGYYSATKFAVEGYSQALQQEVADLGIDVMIVEPSGARTNWAGASSQKDVPTIADYDQFKAQVAGTDASAGSEPGDPQQIAKLIFEQVTSAQPTPKHLPLGHFASAGAQTHLNDLLAEIKSLSAISESADQA